MTHLLRLTLLSSTAISLGSVVLLRSLTGEGISGGGGALLPKLRRRGLR
jgi:hypothetical protein